MTSSLIKTLIKISTIVLLLLIVACSTTEQPKMSDKEVALEWANMTLFITRYTPSNSPTFASRAFGYMGLTMYESIVPGFSEYKSMNGQLKGLDMLPIVDDSKEYNWVLALNAGQSEILKNIYVQTSEENIQKIDSLEQAIFNLYQVNLDKETIDRSVAYGQSVANIIFNWSKTDGGHRGYLKNFDKAMVHPDRPGAWKPPLFAQSFSHHPLHPHWGENRTFASTNKGLEDPTMIPYDTTVGSPYYKQFENVYLKDLELTQLEKEAAIWWGDDPDVSFTPPGHSYYFATLALKGHDSNLIECAAVYAQVGMAVADAFINCWKWKYQFFTERPNTFIPKYIDEEWESFWPDPPFPSFPSGHAIQAAAAATVLEHNFGKDFTFTDRAHEGRARDELKETDFVIRSFDTFWQAAQETADSRFYGGIHTQLDNEVGLEKGVEIAKNIYALEWKNTHEK
ncbi:phosphatase PAP2 family protein [Maribacter hydrothermalis]|uniref:Phosphoesterase n=1 Tax=Maribacter hydrothermalis TaxID=1836467 RepID=A0A1B7ZEN4_9FLAO|nr:phosphatase PAP2 family protein [Maribacter hydrothermalis]APQ17550.1 phosphoesterase [Maribacter hydrothermalis]OBR42025.1 phosphoesterase [Maribacter hydrothermalis]